MSMIWCEIATQILPSFHISPVPLPTYPLLVVRVLGT